MFWCITTTPIRIKRSRRNSCSWRTWAISLRSKIPSHFACDSMLKELTGMVHHFVLRLYAFFIHQFRGALFSVFRPLFHESITDLSALERFNAAPMVQGISIKAFFNAASNSYRQNWTRNANICSQ